MDSENLRSENESSLQDLITLLKIWESMKDKSPNPGTLEIKLFDIFPNMRAYFFDAHNNKGIGYLIPYANHLNSPQSPGFLFELNEDGVAKIYLKGINKIWDNATWLKDYLKAHELKAGIHDN